MRKCFRCGRLYGDDESVCEERHAPVRLTFLDRYRPWRQLRRAWGRSSGRWDRPGLRLAVALVALLVLLDLAAAVLIPLLSGGGRPGAFPGR